MNRLNTFLEKLKVSTFCFLPAETPYPAVNWEIKKRPKGIYSDIICGSLEAHFRREYGHCTQVSLGHWKFSVGPNCQYRGQIAAGRLARIPRAGRVATRSLDVMQRAADSDGNGRDTETTHSGLPV
jgi:hypothetical protein